MDLHHGSNFMVLDQAYSLLEHYFGTSGAPSSSSSSSIHFIQPSKPSMPQDLEDERTRLLHNPSRQPQQFGTLLEQSPGTNIFLTSSSSEVTSSKKAVKIQSGVRGDEEKNENIVTPAISPYNSNLAVETNKKTTTSLRSRHEKGSIVPHTNYQHSTTTATTTPTSYSDMSEVKRQLTDKSGNYNGGEHSANQISPPKKYGHPDDKVHVTKGVHEFEEIIFVHIPKTAGMTFRFTINNGGNFDTPHTEQCYKRLYNEYKERKPDKEPFIFTFFRSPRAHLYSQFLECKHDNWGKRVTRGSMFPRQHSDPEDFERWLDYFYDSWNGMDVPGERVIETECFHCYHPYNLQSRAMSNNCDVLHYLNDQTQNPDDMKYGAKDNMHKLSFVGITELYEASVCLFWIKTGQKSNIKEFCDPKRDKETQVTHHVPKHSIYDVPVEYWKKADKLTRFDSILYNHAVLRFITEFEQLTADHRTKEGEKISLCDFDSHKEGLILNLEEGWKYHDFVKEKLTACN